MTPRKLIFGKKTPNLYVVRFSVFVESNEIFQKFHAYKKIGTLSDVKMQTLSSIAIYRVDMVIPVRVTEF